MPTSHSSPTRRSAAPQEPKQRMTLSQRLTRGGLTFILLGTVAAVLPQQNGVASAAPNGCGTGTPGRYAIDNFGPPGAFSGAVLDDYPVTYMPTVFQFYFSPAPTAAPYNPVPPLTSTITVTSGVLVINGVLVSVVDPPVTNSFPSETVAANADSVQGNPGYATFSSSYIDTAGNTYKP